MNPAPFVVMIPARLASTRLPNKALADLGGRPMVVRVAERARQSAATRVVVATDSRDIVAACAPYGVETIMTAATHQSGTDRLAEAARHLQLPDDAIVVNVQGDEPLIDPILINRVAQHVAVQQVPMATAAHVIEQARDFFDPNCVKVVLNNRSEALYFSRAPIPWPRDAMHHSRDSLPEHIPVLRHIGIYAYRAGFLNQYQQLLPSPLEQIEALEQLRVLWHGHSIGVVVTEQAPAAGVDTPEDLLRVQAFFRA